MPNVIMNTKDIVTRFPEMMDMTLANNKNYSVHLLKSKYGDEVKKHYHKNWNETWYIIDGEFRVFIDGMSDRGVVAKEGDVIYIEKNVKHGILTLSEKATRLAIFKEGVKINYVKETKEKRKEKK